ncbi:Sensory box/GGDEF family protein [hydrothermal vent metagenome]|uniref:Sensory box/GGDEF family protein n=1 Tax=hydrothermal vent metagenome TaxID=652676 RepID=A0A1W1BAD6_9ZZZZ
MQTDLLKLLCKKNGLSYIIFDQNFIILYTNRADIQLHSTLQEYLWEVVGLEDQILKLHINEESIHIPMVLHSNYYYDLEISGFKEEKGSSLFIAIMQQKSKSSKEYANALQKINKKTLIYELSDEKKQTMVNEAALYFFNLKSHEMQGRHFTTFFKPQSSKKSNSTIFIAKNSHNEDLFFYADIIPLTNQDKKVYENIIIAQDITHLKKIKKELEYAQEHDTLTGLANRHYFLKLLDENIKKQKNFFICFIDINDFSTINEEYGAHASDMLLKHLSHLLLEFAEADDTVVRIQADCFAIVFEEQKHKEYIEILCKKLPNLFEQNPLYYSSEDTIKFYCTYAILSYPDDIQTSKDTLALAQRTLQRKKIEKLSR